MIDKELQQGETYDFYFTVRAVGTGKVVVNYSSQLKVAKKIKAQSLGLGVNFNASPEKKNYKCTFTVLQKKNPEMTGFFVIALGEFKGKINLHSLKLLKSNGSQDVPKNGLIEDVLQKEKLAQMLLQKRKASHQVLTRKRKPKTIKA